MGRHGKRNSIATTLGNSWRQLMFLLWKSWKTTLRSIPWGIAQITITIIIWAGLYAILSFARDKFDGRTNTTEPYSQKREGDNAILMFRCINIKGGFWRNVKDNFTHDLCPNTTDDGKGDDSSYYDRNQRIRIRQWNNKSLRLAILDPAPLYPVTQRSDQYNDYFKSSNCWGVDAFHLFAKKVGGLAVKNTSIQSLYFPYISKTADHNTQTWMLIIVSATLPIMIFCAQTSRELAQESVSNIKDYLLSMGMGRTVYYFHHFVFNYFKAIIPLIGISIIIGSTYGTMSLTIYLIVILSMALSSWISIALLIGSIFKKPGTATLLSFFAFLAMMAVSQSIDLDRKDRFLSYLGSLVPHFALMLSLDAKREAEFRGKSFFDNESAPIFTQKSAMFMLFVDSILYFALSVIFDYARSSFDNPLAILKRKTVRMNGRVNPIEENHEECKGKEGADIIVDNVHKMYSTGEYAVRGLDMTFHKGQVTALLGHNGAGKSTTFSMISGMTVPSKGKIKILNCRSKLAKTRAIGFCPQYNAIFPKLTVEEHLKFFARIKGCKTWKEDGERVLTTLGMMDKWRFRAAALSGGMKRKLCIAISLAGNSPIVLLDEPTAGMDTAARRDFERLLMEVKKDHTIILTTHYTDEAELLADRIFIMAKGRVFCSGTPQFLRKRFDSGYVVSFALKKGGDCDRAMAEMTRLAKGFITDVRPNKSRGLQFELKLVEDDTSKFANMFRKIEEVYPSLGIESYGLSLNKLEQVFLKVGELTGTKDRKEEVGVALKSLIKQNDRRIHGPKKRIMQVVYLLYKRFCYDKTHLIALAINLAFIFAVVYFIVPNLASKFANKAVLVAAKDFLSYDECYRIGIDRPLHHKSRRIQQIAHTYGKCLTVVNVTENGNVNRRPIVHPIIEWYKNSGFDRPPILGGLSYFRNQSIPGSYVADGEIERINYTHGYFTYIQRREENHRPLLDTIITMIANTEVKKVELLFEKSESIPLSKLTLKTNRTSNSNNSTMEVESEEITEQKKMNSFTLLILIILTLPQMVYHPISFLIVEHTSNFGHQECLTGVSKIILLIANIIYDTIIFTIHIAIVFIALSLSNKDFIKEMAFAVIFLMYAGFASAELIILIVYKSFSTPAKGENIFLFISFTINMVSGLLCFLGSDKTPTLLLNPAIAMFRAFYYVDNAPASNNQEGKTPTTSDTSSTALIYGLAHLAAVLLIFIVLEYRKAVVLKAIGIRRKKYREDEDGQIVLDVKNLQRWYGVGEAKFVAVKGISFKVHAHECFGVLGVNGAGKTSTFEVLTGNSSPSRGSATVNGVDCRTPATIGYCPQFDALVEDLTGRQCLVILAALHGYKNAQKVTDIVITCVGMEKHANKQTKSYSGGQRRKISVAASLLAQESLIILDEPTAGIDPIARRDIWSVICALRESTNTAIVITSHSMDEVEALVSNLIIMKAGVIAVQGTPQSIKSQYGEHYNFNMSLPYETSADQITQIVKRKFPTATLYDSASMRNIEYRVPRTKVDIFSGLFRYAGEIARELRATDFAFTQATLEDAFIFIASTKIEDARAEDNHRKRRKRRRM